MKHVQKSMLMLGVVTCLNTVACSNDDYLRPNDNINKLSNSIILKWDELAYQAFGGATYQHSLLASRVNAMTHIAMHDALNAISPTYSTYALTAKDANANPIAAAAVAAHTVLLHEIPGKTQFLDSALNESL